MSGDSHSNDDADFLDDDLLEDDFVVEDIVGKDDDLEDLFDEPTNPDSEPVASSPDGTESEGEPDVDDLLFTDHTQGLEPTEEFEKPNFAEQADSSWTGEHLDLEAVGVPETSLESEEEAADPQIVEAKESFAEELDSMLDDEEDFAFEGDEELELVHAEGEAVASEIEDGISEFEQSGPFVLDDGDGLWSEDLAEQAVESEQSQPVDAEQVVPLEELEPVDAERSDADAVVSESHATGEASAEDLGAFGSLIQDESAEQDDDVDEVVLESADDDLSLVTDEEQELEVDGMPLLSAASLGDDVEQAAAGWEPLPSTSMDELSEVDGVQRTDDEHDGYTDDGDTDGEYADEEYADGGQEEYEEVYAGVAQDTDLEDVEGHDIYADDDGVPQPLVLGGPGSHRGRMVSLLLSVAASFLIVLGGTAVVVRPEWFGLSVEPDRVAKVSVPRPRIEVAVSEPPAPAAKEVLATAGTSDANPDNGAASGGDAAGESGDAGTVADGAGPKSVPGTATQPTTQPDVLVQATPEEADESLPHQPVPGSGQPQAGEANQILTTAPGVDSQPGSKAVLGATPPNESGTMQWPVAAGSPEPPATQQQAELARFGDGLLVGGLASSSAGQGKAIDGVMPGSRAFAQLFNGNYFIGQVKQIANETITLRVATGEVTLPTSEIAQLTRLGSADYDELQKATKGFVRLTNNNRLIGGILSRIADDYVVLEFRKNRVMLPKSAIGEIVSGNGGDLRVRLGTTSEEDNWVRRMIKSELGTGLGASPEPEAKAPATSGPPR